MGIECKKYKGPSPSALSDATFENSVMTDVVSLVQTNNTIMGALNEKLLFLHELTGTAEKRNQLFNILNDMIGLMDPSTPAGKFYSSTINSKALPFYLVGMDTLPLECTGPSSQAMSWNDWMTRGGASNSWAAPFQNPGRLEALLKSRIHDLTVSAAQKAKKYVKVHFCAE